MTTAEREGPPDDDGTSRPQRPGSARLQGDEAHLFTLYQERLRRSTAATVFASADNIDEACAYAWSELLIRQPRRETVFAWLRVVARRKAIKLDKADRATTPIDPENGLADSRHASSLATSHRTVEVAQGLLEVRDRLAVLPEEQREIAFMRAAGWRYRDIAECLGITEARVNKLLVRADGRIRQLDERDAAPHSERAARLKQLECDPPPFLLSAIGRPPRAGSGRGREHLRLEWRRIALAVDDYRAAHGISDRYRAFGRSGPGTGSSPATDRHALQQRIDRFTQTLGRGAERTR